MGVFNPSVLTKKGASLSAKVVAGITELQFTKMHIGDSRLTGDLSSLTDIGFVRQIENVSSVVREDNYNISAFASVSNRDLQQGYYIRAIGLYAIDPDEGEILYCISTADENSTSADWMPPFTGVGLTSLSVGMVVAVSNATEVSVTVGDTATVTVAQFNSHIENKENPHGVTAEQIGAVQNTIFGYTPNGKDSLLGVINELISRGYTQGLIQIATEEDVKPTDTPKILSHYAFCKYRKHGNNYVEVELTDDGTLTTYLNKFVYNTDSWLFNWLEIVNHAGYLPLDGSVAMSSGLTIGNGQARFASNEYIATINAYKDVNNPQDAYGSMWVHNDGAISHTAELVRKESGKDAVTYQLFGTHNKPTGSYIGNGDATSRSIEIGGIGNVLLIYTNQKSALILPSCAVFFSNDHVEATWDLTFRNGVLNMVTTSDYVNGLGTTYNYQVL